MADLDATFFHLYSINREDAEYILSTFKGIYDPKPLFPGHFSTAEYILQKYEEMALVDKRFVTLEFMRGHSSFFRVQIRIPNFH